MRPCATLCAENQLCEDGLGQEIKSSGAIARAMGLHPAALILCAVLVSAVSYI